MPWRRGGRAGSLQRNKKNVFPRRTFRFSLLSALLILAIFIHQIDFATPEYDEAVRLRHEVLRRPLGLDFSTDQLAGEYAQIHLAAYDGAGRLLGYLNLTPVDAHTLQMRQVAVAPEHQGRGIGKELVRHSEWLSRQMGVRRIILHARQPAVEFYEQLAYNTVGEPFEEVTIPHRHMEKQLD